MLRLSFYVYEDDGLLLVDQGPPAHAEADYGTFEVDVPDDLEGLARHLLRLGRPLESDHHGFLDWIAGRGFTDAPNDISLEPTGYVVVIVRIAGELEQVRLLTGEELADFHPGGGKSSRSYPLELHPLRKELFQAWAEYDRDFLSLIELLLTAAVRKDDALAS